MHTTSLDFVGQPCFLVINLLWSNLCARTGNQIHCETQRFGLLVLMSIVIRVDISFSSLCPRIIGNRSMKITIASAH